MMYSGWFNFVITALLSLSLLAVVLYYYGFGRKERTEKTEQPKYRMLDDDDDRP